MRTDCKQLSALGICTLGADTAGADKLHVGDAYAHTSHIHLIADISYKDIADRSLVVELTEQSGPHVHCLASQTQSSCCSCFNSFSLQVVQSESKSFSWLLSPHV